MNGTKKGKQDGIVSAILSGPYGTVLSHAAYADGTEFVHAAQAYDGTDYYKHPLELTDAAEELIAYVTNHYSRVIVLLTGSSPIEAGVLRDNEKINAILWTGSVGESGWQGCSYGGWDEIAKLLNGDVNPSGRTVDLWAYDFTANPTWANDGNSGKSFTSAADEEAYQYENVSTTKAWRDESGEYRVRSGHTSNDTVNNYYTVEYEEDLYYGYRYYETMAADYADYNYDNAVAFAFGYGLSYTTFDWEVVSVEDSDWGREQADWQNGGTITLKVKVTNTGDVAGKDVVEIYGHAPYLDGGIEKVEVSLIGFEKTSLLRPGQSETLTISVNIQDIASFDYTDANNNGSKTYELDAADGYELRVSASSHDVKATVKLAALDKDIILAQDDYSGSTVETLFSNSNVYNLLGYDPETGLNLVEEGKMTLMSRASSKGGLKGTMPTINLKADMTRSEKYFEMVDAFADLEADARYGENSYYQLAYGKTAANEAESELPWVKSSADIPADWDQMENEEAQAAAKAASGDSWLNFRDMKGVEMDDARWTTFMNELTWDDMVNLVSHGAYQTVAIDAIEKAAGRYMDSALVVDQELGADGFNWGDCPHSAATWNKELMYRRGVISGNIGLLSEASSRMSTGVGLTGWYAPAADLHRSPFGGRTSEYFSEDGYLSGHIAGNIVAGMASRGILCTIKHVALNENETQRQSLFTYVSEQAAREIYFRAYQIVLQEYSCGAVMTSYNNIGELHSESNYAFMQQLLRDEWGWTGYQCTDAVTPMSNFFSMDTMLRAGSNLLLSNVTEETGVMNNGTGNCAVSGTYDKANRQVVLADGSVSATQWYVVRNAAQQILYVEANSKQSANGYDIASYADKSGAMTQATQGAEYEYAIDIDIDGLDAEYTVVDGKLPDGLSIKTGAANQGGNQGFGGSQSSSSASSLTLTCARVTGTPTTAGHYEFTIQCTANGWQKATASYSLDVAPALTLSDAADALAVGQEFITAIDFANAADFNAGVKYVVAEGSALPEGLTLSEDGIIEGTPVVPGVSTVAITAIGTTSSTNQMNQTTTSYTTEFVFNVVGDAGEAVTITSVVATDAGYTVYFSNGTSTTIAK
jgi:beta-glucosidase-like glycosyl hydrolase